MLKAFHPLQPLTPWLGESCRILADLLHHTSSPPLAGRAPADTIHDNGLRVSIIVHAAGGCSFRRRPVAALTHYTAHASIRQLLTQTAEVPIFHMS